MPALSSNEPKVLILYTLVSSVIQLLLRCNLLLMMVKNFPLWFIFRPHFSNEKYLPLPLSLLVVLLNYSSSKTSKNIMFKYFSSKLHIAQLYTKIKEFQFSRIPESKFSSLLVFINIFWYLWVLSSNYSKNNFIFNLHGTFSIKLKKVILGSFLAIPK